MLAVKRFYATQPKARPQTLVEKIVTKFNAKSMEKTFQGDFISIKPYRIMTHDNTGAVMQKFNSIASGADVSFHNPNQVVFTLDHDVQNKSEANLKKYASIEAFAKKQQVDFYPAGQGIGHQIMIEEGYAFPQTLTVASDSHSNMYGGVGCLGTPVVRTDAAAVWATGQTWWQVPPVVKVELMGKPRPGVTGKDIIVTLCGTFNKDEVLNAAVEFTGDGIDHLSVDDRLTIANMTTEWGALAGLFPVDQTLISWLQSRAERLAKLSPKGNHSRINEKAIAELVKNKLSADKDALYAKHLTIDLSSISPFVSGPNSVKKASPLSELALKKIPIQKAYLVSCTNSRLSDIKQAAEVLKGRKVAHGVEFYIAAASKQVQQDSEEFGYWKTLLDAGAKPLPAGCGPCIGLGTGLLKKGEVGISATNRNYKGRMGSPDAQAYLASPAVVAASAALGYIGEPQTHSSSLNYSTQPIAKVISLPSRQAAAPLEKENIEVITGFTKTLQGEILFCNADNLNTDGIYPGKYTYQDDMTPEMMAKVVMENYDPEFTKIHKMNDILVTGYNFGSGSSREQAATALLHKGVKLVLAGSFSETFKRNAINNGLMVLEAPELITLLRNATKNMAKSSTMRTGVHVDIDLINGVVNFAPSSLLGQSDRKILIPRVGTAAQELIVVGGLEEWVKKKLSPNN